MIYANGFTINATGNECFITWLQNRPQNKTKVTEEVETLVMNEQMARQLIVALAKVYQRIDSDRAAQKVTEVIEDSSHLS